ncbi:hypothetical protein M1563_03645 [Patescibacteria group bacterium]|nr:hypothetical protein [Patescibacteria group bacterium]MCL5410027.1 hypothetical protein [Patescibacteria group bacterium]
MQRLYYFSEELQKSSLTKLIKSLTLNRRGGETMKKIMKYLSAHVMYNSIVHAVTGIGVGILIARPLVGEHPVRWGIALIVVGIAGHLYALMAKK